MLQKNLFYSLLTSLIFLTNICCDIIQLPLNVTYNVNSTKDWGSGYQVDVIVSNTNANPTTSWLVNFNLEQSQILNSVCNASLSNGIDNIQISNPKWLGGNVIPAGGTYNFSFIVSNSNSSLARILNNLKAVGNFQVDSPTPTPTPTPVPTGNIILNSSFKVDSDWVSGYQITVTVKNTTSSPTTTWTAKFNLPNNVEKVNSLWNGNYSVNDTQITVTNPSWNNGGVIPAGGSITFGFVVSNAQAGTRNLLNLAAYGNTTATPTPTPTPTPIATLNAPVLQSINNSNGAYQFQLNWNSVQNATSYVVMQSTSSSFTNPQTIYSGSAISLQANVSNVGTYYYAVKAVNGTTTSAQSNIVSTVVTQSVPKPKAIVEGYWETWTLSDPVNAIVNMKNDVFDISFINFTTTGTHTFKVSGLDCDQATLTQFITAVHNAGKKVKVSLGGASYPLGNQLKTVEDAAGMAQALALFIQQNSLDGVDFDIEDFPAANLQIALLQNTRQLIGNTKLISYTPMTPASTTAPFNQVIKGGHQYLDTISMMAYNAYQGYNYQTDVQALINMGVPASKIVVGLMPGKDDIGITTSLSNISTACQFILQNGLGGIMFWSLNRDYSNATGLGASAATNSAWNAFHS